jgi:hypothetical protein
MFPIIFNWGLLLSSQFGRKAASRKGAHMELNGVLQVFLGGMLGPVLAELLKLAKWGNGRAIMKRYARLAYWMATASLFILAGIVTTLHGVEHVPLLRAVHLGIAAPLIVGAWASTPPPEWQGAAPGVTGLPSLRDLLSW